MITRLDSLLPRLITTNSLGGGGWIRTIEAEATDLQSAPFDHSGTPPDSSDCCVYVVSAGQDNVRFCEPHGAGRRT